MGHAGSGTPWPTAAVSSGLWASRGPWALCRQCLAAGAPLDSRREALPVDGCRGCVLRVGPSGLAGVVGPGVRGQASVNPKAETVEELQGRRKALHMGMLKLAREDLSLTLHAGLDAFAVPTPFSRAPTPQ